MDINFMQLKCKRQTLHVIEDNMSVILGWQDLSKVFLSKTESQKSEKWLLNLTASQVNIL